MPELKINGYTFATQADGNNPVLASNVDMSNITLAANHAGVKTALNASGNAPIYACRAWVIIDTNPYSTFAILDSRNVSSVTNNSAGNFTISFTTAMPDTNYCFTTGIVQEDASYFYIAQGYSGGTYSTTELQIECCSQNGGTTIHGRDPVTLSVAIFR